MEDILAKFGLDQADWVKNEIEPEPMKKYIVRINCGYAGEECVGSMWENFNSIHECIAYIAQHCKEDSSYEIEQYKTHQVILYHNFDFDEDLVYEKIGDVLDCFRIK